MTTINEKIGDLNPAAATDSKLVDIVLAAAAAVTARRAIRKLTDGNRVAS